MSLYITYSGVKLLFIIILWAVQSLNLDNIQQLSRFFYIDISVWRANGN